MLRYSYTCQLFLSQRREILFLPSARVSEDDPTIADQLLLGSTEKEQSSRLFSFKIGEPGVKTRFTWTISVPNWIEFTFFYGKLVF